MYKCCNSRHSNMALLSPNFVEETFDALFVHNGGDFTVNHDCLELLEEILAHLAIEDYSSQSFRRFIDLGRNIQKKLIPLLIYVKNNSVINDAFKIIDTTIKILVNVTVPVEYLISIQNISCIEKGQNTISDFNKLLATSKEAFADGRSTRAIVEHIRYIIESNSQMNIEQCESINNCLLLLRNILHVPENKVPSSKTSSVHSSLQNQIIGNLFTHSIDKITIYLMSCPQKIYWSVTIVQLIALLYKDQHVGTLQKLLNLWLEASYSDSSEDNESNTTPKDERSDQSSPVITSSNPTSDSSDNGGNDRNKHGDNNKNNNIVDNEKNKKFESDIAKIVQNRNKPVAIMKRNKSIESKNSSSGISLMGESLESNESWSPSPISNQPKTNSHVLADNKTKDPSLLGEISDCGYVTQVENQEMISTSSNDDDQPLKAIIYQKPPIFQKTRYTSKNRATTVLEKKELRRKKIVKRIKTNKITMKGLIHHLPTDEEISKILKEFTVDFLLKGYGTLVNDLHTQLLTNIHIQIDTSHFFWLVTYFLKFSIQLEIDPEYISPVLSYTIFSYLIFQGVSLCEELEIISSKPGIDLSPCLRRIHLVVTAIREFLHGIDTYQKMIHLSDEERNHLAKLKSQIGKMEDFKMLFILLLRNYNPHLQSKQYLQDLILTNHSCLLFLDNISKVKCQDYNVVEHLRQYATVEIMRQYGLLLETFEENGEFVNNCIFTMMHHIAGDLQHVSTLYQPSILKTFSKIWETDYKICDDWTDLIEYVIHKFISTPGTHCAAGNSPLSIHNLPNNLKETDYSTSSESDKKSECSSMSSLDEILMLFRWTTEEKDNLLKYYNQSRESSDTIAQITQKYEQGGIRQKTELSVVTELLEQNIISENEFSDLLVFNNDKTEETVVREELKQTFDNAITNIDTDDKQVVDSDIKVLKESLSKENKGQFILWLQNLLLEACYAKLMSTNTVELDDNTNIIEPTVYYFVMLNLPISVIPWTTQQSNILKYRPFILLLHKLGFYLPVDTGKIFVRIPNFWTADYMFSIAQQLGYIDPAKLKFDISHLQATNKSEQKEIKSHHPTSLFEPVRFSMADLQQTPSIVRYTPLPNSSDWFQNILNTKIPPKADTTLQLISRTSQLLTAAYISGAEPTGADEMSISKTLESCSEDELFIDMECSPIHLPYDIAIIEDLERISYCDTASVASDLTRMYVSDEEEKVMMVIEKKKQKS